MMMKRLIQTLYLGSLLALAGAAHAGERHVYLLIGQSNMAGRAPIAESDSGVIAGCLLLNGEDEWEPAKSPMNRHSSIQRNLSMQKLGPAYGFAKAMTKADSDTTLCLVVNARGNTSIEQWAKGTDYYKEAVRRARIAQKHGKLMGILWHQGEANGKQPEGYLDKLITLVGDLRKDLGCPDVPFVVGGIHNLPAINEQLIKLPDAVARTGFASSEGLKAMDRWHFDAESVKLLGKRYAEQIQALQRTTDYTNQNTTINTSKK